jgi:hypothetical protein
MLSCSGIHGLSCFVVSSNISNKTQGCAFFAWSTGRLTNLLTKESNCKEMFDETMEQLNQFIDARNFPPDLSQRLKGFFMLKFPTKMYGISSS